MSPTRATLRSTSERECVMREVARAANIAHGVRNPNPALAVRQSLCSPHEKWDNRGSEVRRASSRVTPSTKEEAMSLGRFVNLGSILLIVLVLAACSSNSPTQPGSDDSIEVDLSRFPDSGDPVPNQTVLTDQWVSIGIIFDAEPVGV